MSLTGGTKLGSYEVIGPLGSGGMGEVYRAHDNRLGREVAIKVLAADKLSDPTRRSRFEQEARTVAALNHPHIVTIHEIEKAGDTDFIVMELVPGKTLDALIPRHGMRLSEVLRIAIPLADALAAAHGAGIVHRDLKPANVMVTPEGVVKVLDFGLAKLRQAEEGGGEDDTTLDAQARLSRPGTVAGTPAYMSPEQASGGNVDARSDIFSFGAVLYEMVTGHRPFGGGSTAEMLASLLKEQPKPPSEIVPDVPKELERIILRCLRKDPERRFQHATDLKVDLLEVKEDSDSQATAPAGAAAAPRGSSRRWVALGVAGILILGTVATVTLWRLRRAEPPPPRLVQLTSLGTATHPSFSPDGNQIVFASPGEKGDNWDIWVKIVGEAEARRLTTDPSIDQLPEWSPDGKQIAFVRFPLGSVVGRLLPPGSAAGSIYVMSSLGGSERRLLDFPTAGHFSWSPDGRWLAAARARAAGETARESGGIHLIPVGAGAPRALTFPQPPARDGSPTFSPDGRTLAYASCGGATWNPACDVYLLPVDSEMRPQARPRRLTRQRLWIDGLAWTRGDRSIVVSGPGLPGASMWRVRVDGGSPPERVELAGTGAGSPSAARGQDRLAFARNSWNPSIYRLRIGGSSTPLITSRARDMWPQYSPDGGRIAFESGRGGTVEIWLAEADGSNPRQLTRGPGRSQGSPRWSPDGRTIAFDSIRDEGGQNVWTIGADGSGLRRVTRDASDENTPSFSRDGYWIYFVSERTGRAEVWRVAAAGGTAEQVTHEGGSTPFESFDGRTLYYLRAMMGNSALLARPTAGGKERLILGCVARRNFAVGAQGVFHVDCIPPDAPAGSRGVLRLLDPSTGRDRVVGALESEGETGGAGLSVSPDGRSILYDHSAVGGLDLMMIEDFR